MKRFLDCVLKQLQHHERLLNASQNNSIICPISSDTSHRKQQPPQQQQQQHPMMKSFISHKALEVSCKKTSRCLTTSSSVAAVSLPVIETSSRPSEMTSPTNSRGGNRSSGGMVQVKTNFYQFGAVKPLPGSKFSITAFKPIHTELGTV